METKMIKSYLHISDLKNYFVDASVVRYDFEFWHDQQTCVCDHIYNFAVCVHRVVHIVYIEN